MITDVNKLIKLSEMSKEAILANIAYFTSKERNLAREMQKARDETLINIKALRLKQN